MKTKEQILKEYGITKDTKFHNYDYLYQSILDAMEEYKNNNIESHNEGVLSKLNDQNAFNTKLTMKDIEEFVKNFNMKY